MEDDSLDQSTCMEFLAPHLDDLRASVIGAFNRYHETPAHILAEHDERAATSGVHSHIVHEIARAFSDVAGASVLNVQGLKVLNLHDRVVLRFKKVSETGRHKNHVSRQQIRFDRQLTLPGLPPAATKLTLGYETDPAFAEIVRVTVGCPLGHGTAPLWLAQINHIEAAPAWEDITPARFPDTGRYERFRDDDAASG